MTTACEVDQKPILTMAFKGTGVCSDLCRKVRGGETVGPYLLLDSKKMDRALAS